MADSGFKEVSLEVLIDFSTLLGRIDTVKLAAKLHCEEPQIMRWSSSPLPDASVAMEVFNDWKGRKPANQRSTLGDAFLEMNRRDLYDILQKKCNASEGPGQSSGATASSTATAAALGGQAETGLGKKLMPGMLFNKISKKFSDIDEVCDLADALLDGIEPSGGTAWIHAKKADGGVLDPKKKARELLDYWCKKSPNGAYGGKLFKELQEVLPSVAEEFKDQLL